jgi:hypothetical protein
LGPEAPGLLALRHALIRKQPGVWADHPLEPRSFVLARPGGGQIEVFGAGCPEPAIGWLLEGWPARTETPIALVAPDDWEAAVRAEFGPVERAEVLTYSLTSPRPLSARVLTRRLGRDDGPAFTALAPGWALVPWRSLSALIARGSAFGVPDRHGGFAAVAWIYDTSARFDSLGVMVHPVFRRLGLGRAVASALIAHILADRRKEPLWNTTPTNTASQALAASLGFANPVSQMLLRWYRGGRGQTYFSYFGGIGPARTP